MTMAGSGIEATGSYLPFEHGVLGKKMYFRFRLLQHTEQDGGRGRNRSATV